MGRSIPSREDRGIVFALFANFDHVAGLYGVGRDIGPFAVDIDMSVADQLAGLRAAGGEPHAVDHAVSAALQHGEHLFACNAFMANGLLVKITKLTLEDTVIAARLLLFAQLQTIAHQLGFLIFSVLAGREIALFDGAFFAMAALTL